VGGGRDREGIAEWRILVLDFVQEESLVLLWVHGSERSMLCVCMGGCTV